MINGSKNETFVHSIEEFNGDSWWINILLMNVIIENAHYVYERTSCMDWVWSKMCGKHSWMQSQTRECIKVNSETPELV